METLSTITFSQEELEIFNDLYSYPELWESYQTELKALGKKLRDYQGDYDPSWGISYDKVELILMLTDND